jgi:hypothetical protein
MEQILRFALLFYCVIYVAIHILDYMSSKDRVIAELQSVKREIVKA